MPRDYAARNRRPPAKKKAGSTPGWVWMLAGLSLGLAVAAFIYISRPAQPLRGTVSAGAENPVEAQAGASAKRRGKPAREAVEIPPKEKPRFTFYELLPSQEVLVPSQEPPKPGARPATQPAAPAPLPQAAVTPAEAAPGKPAVAGELYIIQVASYRSQADAEQQKAGLALLGVESRVEKVTIDNRDTYYRVRVGPERDAGKARAVLAQLEANGISGMLVKVR